ncbi:CoA transferase [Nakamurella sp. YIM 132087]|uniref:CoA transferase n=1 Tax=Nakamurella alba TaxID=2665158 RepID=A0A7K1FE71_9ACTN|nr:CoA transferase [Nakamurella alba]MTD12391.1 CoA transferase [Nakamurella alba]
MNPLRNTLRGVRVLDFSVNLAGPFASMILGDLGADVLKIERPGGGDDARGFAPKWKGLSTCFYALNRNKRSITLDLKDSADRQVARELATGADVLVQSFRPGVLEQLGLGAEELRAVNPGLVHASVSAFGEQGRFRHMSGYDPIVQAFSGLMAMTGSEGGEPVRVPASLTDLSTGMWVALGVLAALRERDASGAGCTVGVSLLDSIMMMMTHQVSWHALVGGSPAPLGSGSPLTAPYQAFPVLDGHVMIAAGNDRHFQRLCQVLDLPEALQDSRFASPASRVQHRDPLAGLIGGRTAALLADELVERLTAASVPCSKVNDLASALLDPAVAEQGLLTRAVGDPDYSSIPVVDLPIVVDGDRFGPHVSAPRYHRPGDEPSVAAWLDDIPGVAREGSTVPVYNTENSDRRTHAETS